jgi:hypothetical protein
MLVTEIYKGQGLGNQLFCYVTTRAIAKKNGYKFGIMNPNKFKCLDFMNLDFGEVVIGGKGPEGGPPIKLPIGIEHYYNEKQVIHPITGADIRMFDENLINIKSNTKIDGLMQDEKYFEDFKTDIKSWLEVKKEYDCFDYSDDNICIINFRGGEYVRHKEVFLIQKYWDDAVKNMLKINKDFKFVVITDDVTGAKKFFPNYDVYHFDIGKDYSIIKNAHYLIMSNSSFAWFPAWLSTTLKYCIAPKYWARYNVSDGYWGLGQNLTKGWMYQDRDGNLHDYTTCKNELDDYIARHAEYYNNTSTPNKKINIKNNIILAIKKKVGGMLSQKTKNKIYKVIKFK